MRLFPLLTLLACAEPLPTSAPPPVQTLSLAVSPLLPGQPTTWTISALNPREAVYIIYSGALSTRGPCPPIAGGLCLDIANPPTVLARAVADNAGVATFSATVPATLTPGATYAFQAVALRGVNNADSSKSPAVARVIDRLAVADLQAGDLVITEMMNDPAVPDAVGEWIELYNRTDHAVDLRGLNLHDDGTDQHTVAQALVVPAHDYAVLGASTSTAVNGGVGVDYAWTNLLLGSGSDAIVLEGPGGVIDALRYGPGFPVSHALSMSLDADSLDAGLNDLAERWCAAPTSPGTPGAANPVCPLITVCGDGLLEPGEACDDHNLAPGDGCDALCQIEPCGDGGLDPGEACDDGNLVDGDGCDDLCQVELCLVQLPRGLTTFNPGNSGYGTPTYVGAAQLDDGDLLWLGSVTVSGGVLGPRPGAYVVRIDGATLQPEWARVLAHPHGPFEPRGIAAASGDSAWIFADTDHGSRRDDISFVRVDGLGQITLSTRLEGGVYDYEYVTAVTATPDDGVAFSGWSYESNLPDEASGLFGKISATGALQWSYPLDTGVFATERMDGVLAMRDGTVITWGREEPTNVVDDPQIILARVSPAGWLDREATIEFEGEITGMVELWNGHALFVGTADTHLRNLFGAITPSWTLQWGRSVAGPGADLFYDPVPSVMPAACAAPPVVGGSCPLPGDRCANTAGLVCTCGAGSTWSCGPERAQIDVGWSIGGQPTWTRHGAVGELIDARRVDTSGASSQSWTASDGGTRSVLRGRGSAAISVVDTDTWHDAACGQSDVTGFTSQSRTWVWLGSTRNSQQNVLTAWTDDVITSTPAPLPPATLVCGDRACN